MTLPSEDSVQSVHPRSLSVSSLYALWMANDPRFFHAESKDSDQSALSWSPIRVYTGRIVDSNELKLSSLRQQRLNKLHECAG